MKKLFALAALTATFTGCGQGWLPLYRGAPCNGCAPSLPAAPTAACNDCGTTSGYAQYDGYNVGDIDGTIVGGPYYGPETPAMQDITQ
ncbi:MAG: hypothetical protein Aurels2KO_06110 [Aureliella sp.]